MVSKRRIPLDHNLDDLLDIKAACQFLGGSRAINRVTLYRGIQDGRFPKPVKIGSLSRWLRTELQAVIDNAAKERS
jgi:predicted DNA-binding transcriptional regulator AlpA